jgi:hypothetical protein
MSKPSARVKAVFFATMTLVASLSISESGSIGDDPVAIQQRAIQRIKVSCAGSTTAGS